MIRWIRSQRGFTLIELLVVVGILAALAGVVTIGVTQFIGRGQTEACQTDLHNVQTAVAACMVDNRQQNGVAAPCNTLNSLVTCNYLLQQPLTPNYSILNSGAVTQGACP